MTNKALITGVTGQDGAYLAQLLTQHGYQVYGTSRRAQRPDNLERLGIADAVHLLLLEPSDPLAVTRCLEAIAPNEIYHLAGQSSVGLSFTEPRESWLSNVTGTLNLLEALRHSGSASRLFVACSGDCFGDTDGKAADETFPFHPASPYAAAKAAAFWLTADYRRAYGVHASSGLFFNPESPLRPERFVTRKIVAAACRIAAGSREKLRLGNIDIRRDWGWAPDYVEAMWLMLQQPQADDYVIATGDSHPLAEFAAVAFAALGLDWREHTETDPGLLRPADPPTIRANPAKARTVLGWRAGHTMAEVATLMVQAEVRARGSLTDTRGHAQHCLAALAHHQAD